MPRDCRRATWLQACRTAVGDPVQGNEGERKCRVKGGMGVG